MPVYSHVPCALVASPSYQIRKPSCPSLSLLCQPGLVRSFPPPPPPPLVLATAKAGFTYAVKPKPPGEAKSALSATEQLLRRTAAGGTAAYGSMDLDSMGSDADPMD